MTLYCHFFKKAGIILILIICIIPVFAQYSLGTTGLLNAPDASMQKEGLFMTGINYLPEDILPKAWDYNSGNYFFNITFFSFMEVAYRCTLLKTEIRNEKKWQQDRSVSLRLRPIKESRYIPSVVVGSNDLLTTTELNAFNDSKRNRYFSSTYAVATKKIAFNENVLCITTGSYFFSKNDMYKGVFGGVIFTPSFFNRISIIAEYDSNCFNAGLTTKLFNHFSLHAFSYDFKAISCGLRYEFCLLK